MKELVKKIPLLFNSLRKLRGLYNRITFSGSAKFWEERYAAGDNSGLGSYNKFAMFKAGFINDFVDKESISTVVEFGCGDGNQLRLADYKKYVGYDVSDTALELCKEKFSDDSTKSFKSIKDYDENKYELALSLDVIYHLIEEDVYHNYMEMLFNSSNKFVIIYSSNQNYPLESSGAHVKHRKFTSWVERNRKDWELVHIEKNKYPYYGSSRSGSFSDFYIYKVKVIN